MSGTAGSQPTSAFEPAARSALILATAALFAIGVVEGGGGSIWADILDDFELDERLLGIGFGVSAFAVAPVLLLGGRLTSRLGSSQMLAVGSVFLVLVSLALVTLAGWPAFLLIFVVRGIGVSLLDLGCNTIAMDIEQATKRHVMGFVHAGFSGGVAFGALLALGVYAAGLPHQAVYVFVAALITVLVFAAARQARRVGRPTRERREIVPRALSLTAFKSRIVQLSGVSNGLAFGVELLISQWVAAYLRSDQGSSAEASVAAVLLFSVTMLIGRLTNGLLTRRVAPELLLVAQGGLVAVGGLLIVASSSLPLTLGGCVIAGLGIAGIVPTVLSLAAAHADGAAGDTAGASLIGGYLGALIIPVLASGLTSAFSLRAGVSLVPVGGIVLVATGLLVVRELRKTVPVTAFAG